MTVRIQEEDFDLGTEIAALRKGDAQVGAVVSILGTVRDMNEGCQVEVISFGKSSSAKLKEAAHAFTDMCEDPRKFTIGPRG